VRRVQAVVGRRVPFDPRRQLKLLADLEITTKAVKGTAEAIGGFVAAQEQVEIQRAVQLDLVVDEPIPILCVQMDGTGIPVVRRRRWGGPDDGQHRK
jgi:hypothetical protein